MEEGLRLASRWTRSPTACRADRPTNQDEKEEQLYEKLVKRTRSLAAELRVVFGMKAPEERVYYVEQIGGMGRRTRRSASVSAAPLHVTEMLREKLFDRIPTIATSATLAVGGDFRFFRSRVGLNAAKEAVLPLSLRLSRACAALCPAHAARAGLRRGERPVSGRAGGADARAGVASRGAGVPALQQPERAARRLTSGCKAVLEALDFSLLVQGRDIGAAGDAAAVPRVAAGGALRAEELLGGGGCRRARRSRWWRSTSCRLIRPTIRCRRRGSQDEGGGENWFGDYVLPMAILRLKQGIGRLLRTRRIAG